MNIWVLRLVETLPPCPFHLYMLKYSFHSIFRWSLTLCDASNNHPLDISGLEGPGLAGRPAPEQQHRREDVCGRKWKDDFWQPELLSTLQPEAMLRFRLREPKTNRKTCWCRHIPSVALSSAGVTKLLNRRVLNLKILVLPNIIWSFCHGAYHFYINSIFIIKVIKCTAYNPTAIIKSNQKSKDQTCCRRKGLLIWMWLRQSKQKLFLKGREAG